MSRAVRQILVGVPARYHRYLRYHSGMALRAFTMRVGEEILQAFDEVAWERRMSRTGLLVELMVEAVASTRAVPADWRTSTAEVAVTSEVHERTRKLVNSAVADRIDVVAQQVSCEHPKDKRVKFAWGSKCGVCNSIVR